MLTSTLPHLRCPKHVRKRIPLRGKYNTCGGTLKSLPKETFNIQSGTISGDIRSGELICETCGAKFPILAGVAILVNNVPEYLLSHVKGIAALVPVSDIPPELREDFLAAKEESSSAIEHIEEDLEAQRVNSLYLMNHYLRINAKNNQWKGSAQPGNTSPLIDSLMEKYWDNGPFAQIRDWVQDLAHEKYDTLELGCGVGGLYTELKPFIGSYLGIDSSFASIALARHIGLGLPYQLPIAIPDDLLQGSVSRKIKIEVAKAYDGRADFIVGDLDCLPIAFGSWGLSISLNTIDMLHEPESLPKLQFDLLKSTGMAIQSSPYVWHDLVAKKLRKTLPREIKDSATAVEWLYTKSGFTIKTAIKHLPWLFFKHVRQLEVYSVHLFLAQKNLSRAVVARAPSGTTFDV